MTKTSTPPRSDPPRAGAGGTKKSFPVWALLIGAVIVAGILAVVLTSGGDDDDKTATTLPGGETASETAPVTVTGEPLPVFEQTADDEAVGLAAPVLTGTDFASEPVTIPASDGKPKAIFFVAHWCPHCRREIPNLAKYLEEHGAPEGVDIEIVSTRVDESPDNYPPSAWLAREGVGDLPVITDDGDSTAYYAYGAGGLPYIVYLDKDDEVVLRTEGEYGDDPEIYSDIFDKLAAGELTSDPRGAG
jgi:cytochrome c biogenesis protein CcmG/thiol:disulfide interchange protein DsbE